jgi:hypothetical protein
VPVRSARQVAIFRFARSELLGGRGWPGAGLGAAIVRVGAALACVDSRARSVSGQRAGCNPRPVTGLLSGVGRFEPLLQHDFRSPAARGWAALGGPSAA